MKITLNYLLLPIILFLLPTCVFVLRSSRQTSQLQLVASERKNAALAIKVELQILVIGLLWFVLTEFYSQKSTTFNVL